MIFLTFVRNFLTKVEFTFLGTGTSQGIPIIGCKCSVCTSDDFRNKRLRSSALIRHQGKTFLIDAGPDFREQMLRANVTHLDFILLTHAHRDHISGLDDVRAYNYLQQRPMDIYAQKIVLDELKIIYAYAFETNPYPGVPEFHLHEVGQKTFSAHNIPISPIEVMHHKLPILGFRIGNLTYITDAKTISETELEKIKGTKVLVINALRTEEHLSHFSLDEALAIIRLIEPEQAYLTHISHLLGDHDSVSAELPPNVFLGYDGLQVTI